MIDGARRVFLEGSSIYLRALERDDLTDRYLQWFNDAEICAGNGHAIWPNTRKRMHDYFDASKASDSSVVLAILTRDADEHIGNVSLQEIDWVSRVASFAIIIGDRRYWAKGVGREAGWLALRLGFERLNLHRVQCGTFDNNKAMQKLAKSLAMKREGLRREAFYKDGKYRDIIEYGVLRKDFAAVDRN